MNWIGFDINVSENLQSFIKLILDNKEELMASFILSFFTIIILLINYNQTFLLLSNKLKAIHSILPIIILSFSFLTIFFLFYFVIRAIKKKYLVWQGNKKEKHQKEIMQKQVKKLLPTLSMEQITILAELRNNPTEFNRYSQPIIFLKNNRFIKIITLINNDNGLFELNPIIKSIINHFINEKRQQVLTDYIKNLSQDERNFIKLFAIPSPIKSSELEHPRLTYNIFQASRQLINKGILTNKLDKNNPDKETIQIGNGMISIIEKYILSCKAQRTIIVLDLNNIQGNSQFGSDSWQHTLLK